ncbi:kinase-like domain-containing protein [Thelephora terrestris]|uniref:Kinase-like domain-containing protein n=1 Tax=Thelephora terrestris TaxID=56493 RepID=A0A9P6H6M4_9AGAM|nr:kinase-like domain-containing protein [Thelephora terrestris]
MVHGDLKGANILIDQNRHARLADFGLLTIISDPTNTAVTNSLSIAGTTRWMSPELLDPSQFGSENTRPTKESDSYALGMVILEVLSGQPPFALHNEFMVMRLVTEGKRPERPNGPEGVWFTDDLWQMLNRCWEIRPESRASIGAIFEYLGRVSGTWKSPFPRAPEKVQTDEGMAPSSNPCRGVCIDRAPDLHSRGK